MLRNFTLQPNEDKRLQVEGQFLVVTQATGPIELSIGGTTPITVDEKDRVNLRSDSPNDRALRIKNVAGGVNTIELHTSDLLIDKRTGVDVKNSISIAEDQRIGIDPGANIVQAVIQNPVRIDANENTVKIEKDQCIGISPKKNMVKAYVKNAVGIKPDENDVKATIVNNVTLVPGQRLGIDTDANHVNATLTDSIAIKENQAVGIDSNHNTVQVQHQEKVFQTLPTLSFVAPAGSVPGTLIEQSILENPLRDVLILTASPNNIEPIWLGGQQGEGTPIFPGDRLLIEGNNTLLLAALDGHTLYLSEVNHKV